MRSAVFSIARDISVGGSRSLNYLSLLTYSVVIRSLLNVTPVQLTYLCKTCTVSKHICFLYISILGDERRISDLEMPEHLYCFMFPGRKFS
jgi:hypothetical protein